MPNSTAATDRIAIFKSSDANGAEISQKSWGPFEPLVLQTQGPYSFIRARFLFSYMSYTSGIEMSQHYLEPFWPLVFTFCGPTPFFEGLPCNFYPWILSINSFKTEKRFETNKQNLIILKITAMKKAYGLYELHIRSALCCM